MDAGEHEDTIKPSQGVHIVLDKVQAGTEHALMIPKTSDGRVLFAVPWHDHLIVGTTDTPLDEIKDEPEALDAEIEFILNTASAYFKTDIQRKDVRSVFAGLRPLAAPKKDDSKTKEISRNHKILVSKSKMITLVGGKWTTYRKMGEDAIQAAIKQGLLTPALSRSKNHHFVNGPLQEEYPAYGDHGHEIYQLAMDQPALQKSIHPDLPYTKAEFHWMIRNEMVLHLEDVLARRSRSLFLNARASIEIAEEVAGMLATTAKWDTQKTKSEIESFSHLAEKYILS
jgi:glycerol-3-phosphate dehydrogenase